MNDWQIGEHAWVPVTMKVPTALIAGVCYSVSATVPDETVITTIQRDTSGAIVLVAVRDVNGLWEYPLPPAALYRDRAACAVAILARQAALESL